MTLDALFSAMNSKFDLTLRRIEESNASIATKIDTVKAELEGKLDAVTREINNFKGECATKFQSNEAALSGLCEQVNEIRQEMGGLEKRDELIVSGIPYLPEVATVEKAILAIPWSDFFASNEPDLLANFFNEQVKQVHDACIPLRTKKGSKVSNAWFTNVVRTSMLECDLAYGDWRRAPRAFKDEARRRYNTLRNRTNAIFTRTM
ncbi:hypothetical protein quinque_013357 [Culex quinquefasciatus]